VYDQVDAAPVVVRHDAMQHVLERIQRLAAASDEQAARVAADHEADVLVVARHVDPGLAADQADDLGQHAARAVDAGLIERGGRGGGGRLNRPPAWLRRLAWRLRPAAGGRPVRGAAGGPRWPV